VETVTVDGEQAKYRPYDLRQPPSQKTYSAARIIGPAGAPSCALRALIERRACSIARNTGQ
jgi:hypothetical protein